MDTIRMTINETRDNFLFTFSSKSSMKLHKKTASFGWTPPLQGMQFCHSGA